MGGVPGATNGALMTTLIIDGLNRDVLKKRSIVTLKWEDDPEKRSAGHLFLSSSGSLAMFAAIRRASSAHEEFQQPQQIKNAENDKGIESETNNHYRDRPRNHRNTKLLIIFCVHAKLSQKPIMTRAATLMMGETGRSAIVTIRYADIFRLSAAIRQFSYIHRDPPRLILAE